MSWQCLCLRLSCFTDFEGHQILLIDARCKMNCRKLWKSSEFGYSEIWILGNKNEWMREFYKSFHNKMPNRQNWYQQWLKKLKQKRVPGHPFSNYCALYVLTFGHLLPRKLCQVLLSINQYILCLNIWLIISIFLNNLFDRYSKISWHKVLIYFKSWLL